ncbi:MAG: hypothetical protein ACRCSK_00730 [Fusobacteriaceae bacterium]
MKIIFCCPNYFEYGIKISKVMEKMGHEILFIPSRIMPYKYKNIFERIYNNIFIKKFLKKDLKTIRGKKIPFDKIKKFGDFDFAIFINASNFGNEILEEIKKKNKPMILHLWDSTTYSLEEPKYFHFFDSISSFDYNEAKKFGMKFLPNFYFTDDICSQGKLKYDIFTVMGFDERFPILEKIAKNLKENKVKYLFIVKKYSKNIENNDYIKIQKSSLSLEENYKYISESKAILEVGHTEAKKKQGGLSMRALDALGNKKKLVTTYDIIKNYDFYDPQNIFVLEKDNFNIPKSFFETQHKEVSKEIYEKYCVENWIKTLLSFAKK